MMRIILFVGLAIALWGCVSNNGGSPYTETGAICDNAGLESQVQGFHDRSNALAGALGVGVSQGGGAIGLARDKEDISRIYRVRDLIYRYDAEIEALARNIVASCKNHTRCMERNGYREGRCLNAYNRWTNAEAQLADLAEEFREIEAETQRLIAAIEQQPVVVGRGRGRGAPFRVNPYESCTCDESVGGVFANCCDAGQPAHRDQRRW